MNLPLSPRLLACAGFVCPGECIADVGCDHGYLSIYLLKKGIASFAIASDINEGPLRSAYSNAQKYGVADRMSFHLSDGLKNVPQDFDTLVCAGMGATTMISILDAAPWLKSNQYRLILQCQIKTHLLRQYLSENGWRITEESLLRDGKFLYTVLEAVWQPDYPRLTIGECYFPPALLENPGIEIREHYNRILKMLRVRVEGYGENADPREVAALQELERLQQDENLDFLKEETP